VKYNFKNGHRFKAAGYERRGKVPKYIAINVNKNKYKLNQLPDRFITT